MSRTGQARRLAIVLVFCAAAACNRDDFAEGKGSKAVIGTFIGLMNSGAAIPPSVLSAKGAAQLGDAGGGAESSGRLRGRLLSPIVKDCHLLDLAKKDAVLPDGRITREAKVRASGEADDIEYEAIYNLRFELSKAGGGDWLIDKVDTVGADLTLANTGVIFKIYYVLLTISAVMAFQGLVKSLRRQYVDPHEARRYYLMSPGAFGTMLGALIVFVSWFAFFFEHTFVSHFGFYWGLGAIAFVMRQLLLRYDYGHFAGRMPAGRFLVWALSVVPVLVFLSYQSKFKPEQTSTLSLSFDGPPVAETTRETVLRADASATSDAIETLASGTTLGYLGASEGAGGKFMRVVHEQTTIGFVSAEAATVKAKPRTFQTEAEFTTELEGFFRAMETHKVGVPARLADIGRVYFDDGVRHARRGSVREHLEALSRYREAAKYRDDDELRLAGAHSVLEIVRKMRRDNILNAFGLAHEAAVSYNKTRALAAYTVHCLSVPPVEAAFADDQKALVALAHFFGDDDRKEAAKRLPASTANEGRYLATARAHLEKDPDKALALWDEIARRDPDDSAPFVQLGMRLLAGTNVDRADASFARALGLGPDDPEARVGAAAVLIGRGNSAEGNKILEEAIRATSYNSEPKVLRFISANERLMTGLFWVCLFFCVFAGRIAIVRETVFGTWLRVISNGVVFSAVLLAVWYRLVAGEGGVSEPLRLVVRKSLF